eukprot:TRINITY_DN64956_c0_g1_i1.p1 TRINITY_DN64956_c0_g1~~TRINITY_DN64956_c0_g1_i1.p1  ORF type:complete len:258 (-),score=19.59 TRINITY_DN64956_c0_g1_i1:638-1411(-)
MAAASPLKQLADNVYYNEAYIRFYGVKLQTRMAVIRLTGERLLLYSPTPLDDELRAALQELGRVAYIVSPNKIHNQTLAAYQATYPEAWLCGPPGLAERRPGLRVERILTADPEPEWATEVDQALTDGNCFFREVLLLHRASGTLLVGDFIENIRAVHTPSCNPCCVQGFARLFGIESRPMASPEFRYYTDNADRFVQSVAKARTWNCERIFLCHGDMVLDSAAPAVLGDVCEDLQREVSRRSRLTASFFRFMARWQ